MIDVLHHIDEENEEVHHEVINQNHNHLHSIDHLLKNNYKRMNNQQMIYFDDEVLNHSKHY